MVTKNQHVIPRCYLKHFVNSNNKVFAYNVIANNIFEKDIENVCSHRYAYEVSKNEVANILEKELASIEKDLAPYLDGLIEKTLNKSITRDYINNYNLFKYINLLFIRTDSNRVLFVRNLLNFEAMDHHMSLKELKDNHHFLTLFNMKFKQPGYLNYTLEDLYNKTKPEIRIGITEKDMFITSDNPVILFYIPDEENYFCIKFILPIHPRICIYYFGFDKIGISKEKQECFPYIVKSETVNAYNQGIINVANHWIISSRQFSFLQLSRIYHRFEQE